MAYDYGKGWLHLHADWAILEPVTTNYDPVPAGFLSDTVLLTNLANRVQPLIRYDLGDRIKMASSLCPCGSPLPALRVEGRTNDVVVLSDGSRTVSLLPLALVTVIEEVAGVRRCQLVQTGPITLRVRLELTTSSDDTAVWQAVDDRLRGYLATQQAPETTIQLANEPPAVETGSGKLRQVVIEPTAQASDG
jgi:phenylacetate-CoA ligase